MTYLLRLHRGQSLPRELIVLLAALTSLNALSIDVMLPALPLIGEELELSRPNLRQWVVLGFSGGMGLGQLIFGPLSDRFGRKPTLMCALSAYSAIAFACTLVSSFEHLVALRMLQGVSAAGARVSAVVIVRDVLKGSAMARAISVVGALFMTVPIIAPLLGEAMLHYGSWRILFLMLAMFAVTVGVWSWIRLPETLSNEHRRTRYCRSVVPGYMEVVRQPVTMGYMFVNGLMFAALISFIGAAEQVFAAFGRSDSFAYYFAGLGVMMGVSNLMNVGMLRYFNPRQVARAALLIFVPVQLMHMWASSGSEPSFAYVYVSLILTFMMIGPIGANCLSLALEPVGHLAGTASALGGFMSAVLGVVIGGAIGQQFDGSTMPFAIGYTLLAVVSLGVMLTVEATHPHRASIPR